MNNNIDDLIESKIDSIVNEKNIYHVGKVVRINEFVVEATGLDDAFFFEKVFIGGNENIGYVDKIEESKVTIALVKTNGNIKVGDLIKTSGEALQASFSKNSMGMVIDAFGTDRMSLKNFNDSKAIAIETPNIPIMDRTAVNRPLETGIAGIDLMFPIGRGQRQLIIGDKKTGKTQILLDTIVNQKNKNVICIYVSIGKTKKEVKRLYTKLIEKGANSYTTVVAAFNDDTSPMIKLTPYVGISIAQEYMMEGKDVLVCIDDLKKHADACREIALISEKNTGREAYPADIFYTHSRMLEKGCQHKNGGSITILPVVETKGGDITDYISTNIISITDGQIVLNSKAFKKGQKPAIDFGLSVSRLGSAVQKEGIKKIGARVRQELLSYLETADVYQLVKIDSMSRELQEKMLIGKKILTSLNQQKFSPKNEEKLIENFEFILQVESSLVKKEKTHELKNEVVLVPGPVNLDKKINDVSDITTVKIGNVDSNAKDFFNNPTGNKKEKKSIKKSTTKDVKQSTMNNSETSKNSVVENKINEPIVKTVAKIVEQPKESGSIKKNTSKANTISSAAKKNTSVGKKVYHKAPVIVTPKNIEELTLDDNDYSKKKVSNINIEELSVEATKEIPVNEINKMVEKTNSISKKTNATGNKRTSKEPKFIVVDEVE